MQQWIRHYVRGLESCICGLEQCLTFQRIWFPFLVPSSQPSPCSRGAVCTHMHTYGYIELHADKTPYTQKRADRDRDTASETRWKVSGNTSGCPLHMYSGICTLWNSHTMANGYHGTCTSWHKHTMVHVQHNRCMSWHMYTLAHVHPYSHTGTHIHIGTHTHTERYTHSHTGTHTFIIYIHIHTSTKIKRKLKQSKSQIRSISNLSNRIS